MAGCAVCLHKNVHPNVCSDCLGGTHFTPRNITNADRIRHMSDEELAARLCELIYNCDLCPGSHLCTPSGGNAAGLMKWMKQKATDEDVPMDYMEAGGTL